MKQWGLLLALVVCVGCAKSYTRAELINSAPQHQILQYNGKLDRLVRCWDQHELKPIVRSTPPQMIRWDKNNAEYRIEERNHHWIIVEMTQVTPDFVSVSAFADGNTYSGSVIPGSGDGFEAISQILKDCE